MMNDRKEGYYWVKLNKECQKKGFNEWEIGYHFGNEFDVFTVLDFELVLGKEIVEVDENRIERVK